MAALAVPAEKEFVFQQAVEGLFKVGLRSHRTPELEQRLRQVGLDLARPLLPAYPRPVWNQLLRVTAETLWPASSQDVAYRALGRQMILGYMETLVGRALTSLVRMLGPRRMLDRMERNLRSGCNYNLTRVTEVGPAEVLFWVNEPLIPPAYLQGLLEAALEQTGVHALHVEPTVQDAEGCTYRIRWGL